MKTLADIAFEEEEAQNAPKSANHYVSTTPIPDWLETSITKLSKDSLASFGSDLALSIAREGGWVKTPRCWLSDRAYEWLKAQDRNTFKSLLQWVAMELID
jgi:hypothetical protein